jgi:hypothetical protein
VISLEDRLHRMPRRVPCEKRPRSFEREAVHRIASALVKACQKGKTANFQVWSVAASDIRQIAGCVWYHIVIQKTVYCELCTPNGLVLYTKLSISGGEEQDSWGTIPAPVEARTHAECRHVVESLVMDSMW